MTAVLPSTGINNAATAITITGQNFRSGATATVGGQVCANLIVLSPTSLACSVPAKTATCTAQNVVVTHPDDLQKREPEWVCLRTALRHLVLPHQPRKLSHRNRTATHRERRFQWGWQRRSCDC